MLFKKINNKTHLIHCGNDLGEVKVHHGYICPSCESLILISEVNQKKITNYKREGKNVE